MNKKNLFPIIALTVIGVVVAALLGFVNMKTAPIVEEAERQAMLESLRVVMPGGEFGGDEIESEKIPEDAAETVKAIYKEKNGKGHVVVLKTQGYASVISITVGVDSEGKVTKAIVTSEAESHGQAGMKNYTDRFEGLNAGGVSGAALYSGATVTSGAIRDALVDAMYALGYVTAGDGGGTDSPLPKTDDEIKTLAEGYVGGAVEELTLSANAPKTLKRLYYHAQSGSYVAYNITSTKYVSVETEGFVVIGADGVIDAIDMLTWTVGHGVNPQDSFVKSFVGKNKNSIVSAELVTQATGTSMNFTVAVRDALVYVTPEDNSAKVVGAAILISAVAISVCVAVIYNGIRRKRR